MSGKLTCLKCERKCRKEIWYRGKWMPLCRYHIAAYYDLPHRDIIV